MFISFLFVLYIPKILHISDLCFALEQIINNRFQSTRLYNRDLFYLTVFLYDYVLGRGEKHNILVLCSICLHNCLINSYLYNHVNNFLHISVCLPDDTRVKGMIQVCLKCQNTISHVVIIGHHVVLFQLNRQHCLY